MTWRDDLVDAKLDDVTFLYRSVKDKGGNRNVLFEYPGRADPFVEDMGPKAKRWTLDAFLIGENYHVALGNFLDVLNTPGVRKFQHPYDGEFPVKLLGEYEVTRSDREGGMAQVTFTLVEAGLAFPLVPSDSGAKVRSLLALGLPLLEDKTKFSLLGAIKDIIAAVLGALGKALSAINKVNGKIAAALGVIDNAAFLVDEIGNSLTDLINTPGALMNKLNNLIDQVVGLVKDLLDLIPQVAVDVEEPVFPQAELLLAVFVELASFEEEPETVPTATPQAEQEAAAFAAINLNMKAATTAITSGAVTEIELESSADAAKIQQALAQSYDEILAVEDLDPEVFEIFAALKAATVEHLTVVQQNLPSLANYTPQQTMPALVIAYELYGDATRDRELISRNKIRHPGFVPGGQALEVIADD